MLRFHEPFLTGREQGYLAEVLAGGSFAGNGPFGKRVQAWLERHTGCPHVLLTHSCTGALEMAALLADLQPGDEVLLPSFTFVSTATAFLRAGAKLVFCEVDPATMTLDLADVARRLTSRSKVVVPVHYAGLSCDMAKLVAFAKEHRLQVVEDAAQGLDAFRDGRHLGTWGSLGTLSFHETKNVHCGLGGALLINDPGLLDRAEIVWERGTNRQKMFKGLVDKYSWVDVGSSFYMTELQAAFLLAQLEALADNTALRLGQWHRYAEQLAPLAAAGHVQLAQVPAGAQANGHCFFLLARSGAEADALREFMVGHGFQATIHYVPLHASEMGRRLGYADGDLPVTLDGAARLLRLPLHHKLQLADIDAVAAGVRQFYGV